MKRSTYLAAALCFSVGWIAGDLAQERPSALAPAALADVAGMDAYGLRTDYAFKRAVNAIVEDELTYLDIVDRDEIDAMISLKLSSCYIDGGEIYCF